MIVFPSRGPFVRTRDLRAGLGGVLAGGDYMMSSGTGRRTYMRSQCGLLLVAVFVAVVFTGAPSAGQAGDIKLTRDIKLISSAGARALADACTAWAEKNKLIVAMAILD